MYPPDPLCRNVAPSWLYNGNGRQSGLVFGAVFKTVRRLLKSLVCSIRTVFRQLIRQMCPPAPADANAAGITEFGPIPRPSRAYCVSDGALSIYYKAEPHGVPRPGLHLTIRGTGIRSCYAGLPQ